VVSVCRLQPTYRYHTTIKTMHGPISIIIKCTYVKTNTHFISRSFLLTMRNASDRNVEKTETYFTFNSPAIILLFVR